eukprot:scaffold2364_cov426-Prasinococcus_capsulatus_cf.AAC.6
MSRLLPAIGTRSEYWTTIYAAKALVPPRATKAVWLSLNVFELLSCQNGRRKCVYPLESVYCWRTCTNLCKPWAPCALCTACLTQRAARGTGPSLHRKRRAALSGQLLDSGSDRRAPDDPDCRRLRASSRESRRTPPATRCMAMSDRLSLSAADGLRATRTCTASRAFSAFSVALGSTNPVSPSQLLLTALVRARKGTGTRDMRKSECWV